MKVLLLNVGGPDHMPSAKLTSKVQNLIFPTTFDHDCQIAHMNLWKVLTLSQVKHRLGTKTR